MQNWPFFLRIPKTNRKTPQKSFGAKILTPFDFAKHQIEKCQKRLLYEVKNESLNFVCLYIQSYQEFWSKNSFEEFSYYI